MRTLRETILEALAQKSLTRDELCCLLKDDHPLVHEIQIGHDLDGLLKEKRIQSKQGRFCLVETDTEVDILPMTTEREFATIPGASQR